MNTFTLFYFFRMHTHLSFLKPCVVLPIHNSVVRIMNECKCGGRLIDRCTTTISWSFVHPHSLQSASSPIPPMMYSIDLVVVFSASPSWLILSGPRGDVSELLPAERNHISNGDPMLEGSFEWLLLLSLLFPMYHFCLMGNKQLSSQFP
jgi:hypothetical protein